MMTSQDFDKIVVADGRYVRLIQQAYNDNYHERPAWFAAGYLSTEDADDETGPTVIVRWDSLGTDEAIDDADWDRPVSIYHYAFGELQAGDSSDR